MRITRCRRALRSSATSCASSGYEIGFVGKSHVGGALLDHKWDYYFGFKGQADYLKPEVVEGSNGQYGEPEIYHEYVDDLLTRKAVEWVQGRGRETVLPVSVVLCAARPVLPTAQDVAAIQRRQSSRPGQLR